MRAHEDINIAADNDPSLLEDVRLQHILMQQYERARGNGENARDGNQNRVVAPIMHDFEDLIDGALFGRYVVLLR